MAVCSKPIPGRKMKTRNFGKKSRRDFFFGGVNFDAFCTSV